MDTGSLNKSLKVSLSTVEPVSTKNLFAKLKNIYSFYCENC